MLLDKIIIKSIAPDKKPWKGRLWSSKYFFKKGKLTILDLGLLGNLPKR